MVKNLLPVQETWVGSLSWKDPLEKSTAAPLQYSFLGNSMDRETWLARVLACVVSRFSHVPLFATHWTVACQALLSMGFSRQEHWSGLPCPPPEVLPDPGIETASPLSPTLAGSFFTTSSTWEIPGLEFMGSQRIGHNWTIFTLLC